MQPGRQLRPREQPGDELPALRLRQRIEPDRHRARDPIGRREDSRPVRPRRRNEQHRAVRADSQRVQHLHEPVVRPVEVLEHEHQRPARRERGDKPRPGPGDVLAHLLRLHLFERALRERETGRCGKGVRHQPHLVIRRADVGQGFAHPGAQLVARRLRRIVERDAERRSQDLAERPVGDPPARREAAPAVDGRARLDTAGAVDELLHQPALPDAGGAAHEDRPHLPRRRRLTEALISAWISRPRPTIPVVSPTGARMPSIPGSGPSTRYPSTVPSFPFSVSAIGPSKRNARLVAA